MYVMSAAHTWFGRSMLSPRNSRDKSDGPASAGWCPASAPAPPGPSGASAGAPDGGRPGRRRAVAPRPRAASRRTAPPDRTRRAGASTPDPPAQAWAPGDKCRPAPPQEAHIAGAPTRQRARGRSWPGGPAGSFAGPPGQKIPLHSQPANLRVQLRLAITTVVPHRRRTKNRRGLVETLLLPAVDLIGMDAVPGRQLRYRRLFAHRLQSHPGLECRIELPSRSAHHPLRLLRRNGTKAHLSRWSQNPGPLLASLNLK